MTREETKRIIRIIVSSYPNYKPSNLTDTVDVWNMVLEEYTYKQVSLALKAYILSDTSGFAPSIGQLVDKIQTIENSNPQLNELEAWALVSKALRNGTYGAEEEFEKLPELVQKTIGSPSQLRNWATTDSESVENVIQSNFMRTYRTMCAREKETFKMPTEIKNMIEQNSNTKVIDTIPKPIIEQINIAEYEGVPMPANIKKEIERMKAKENI